jgi:hypothetical protein
MKKVNDSTGKLMEYSITFENDIEATSLFNEIKIVMSDNTLINKMELKLVVNKASKNYKIFLITLLHLNRKFKILRKFDSLGICEEQFKLDYYEQIDNFGLIENINHDY